MLKTKKISETYEMRVFTDDGVYFGDIEESIFANNKIFGWRVRATKGSYLSKVLGGAKGVIIPHQYIKAIGTVFIVNKEAVPSYEEEGKDEEMGGSVVSK